LDDFCIFDLVPLNIFISDQWEIEAVLINFSYKSIFMWIP